MAVSRHSIRPKKKLGSILKLTGLKGGKAEGFDFEISDLPLPS